MKFMPAFLLISLLALCGNAAEPFRPNLGPDLPSFTVTCGDVTLLLRQASQWTPGRIDFRGTPMTTEKSAYGTVISFPDVGFIGTGHLENEPEPIQSLAFFLDGEKVETPGETLAGKTFRLERESTIRDFKLKGVVEVKNDRIYETATLTSEKETPLKLLYHFMHAWTPTVSQFLAGNDDTPDDLVRGDLLDTEEVIRQFYVKKKVDWFAVFEPQSGQFAVSRLLEAPESAGNITMIWNVPPTYRKFYLKCLERQTVPAGFAGTWRMVTAFGSSEAGKWEAAAQKLASQLKGE
jgi:hypothetical protein